MSCNSGNLRGHKEELCSGGQKRGTQDWEQKMNSRLFFCPFIMKVIFFSFEFQFNSYKSNEAVVAALCNAFLWYI